MILLINGPFGIGKTTTAREVVSRLNDSLLFDPEVVGTYLRHILGAKAPQQDYQDLALWRDLTVDIARRIHGNYATHLIVPMCFWRYDYFNEITSGWQAAGVSVICFRLTCSEETLRTRILSRANEEGGHDWCLSHLPAGLAAARDSRFGIEVSTEGRCPGEIADHIVTTLGMLRPG